MKGFLLLLLYSKRQLMGQLHESTDTTHEIKRKKPDLPSLFQQRALWWSYSILFSSRQSNLWQQYQREIFVRRKKREQIVTRRQTTWPSRKMKNNLYTLSTSRRRPIKSWRVKVGPWLTRFVCWPAGRLHKPWTPQKNPTDQPLLIWRWWREDPKPTRSDPTLFISTGTFQQFRESLKLLKRAKPR